MKVAYNQKSHYARRSLIETSAARVARANLSAKRSIWKKYVKVSNLKMPFTVILLSSYIKIMPQVVCFGIQINKVILCKYLEIIIKM